MTRIKSFYFAVTLTAVVVAITLVSRATVFESDPRVQVDPADLPKVLDVPPQIAQYHLYSGAVNGVSGRDLVLVERKVDLFENGALMPSASYATNKDRSSESSQFHLDGPIAGSSSYYPSSDGVRHLHVKSEFSADGKLRDEDVRHMDGTPEKRTQILASGEKHVVEFAADGVSILDDALYVPDACCSDLIVKSEKRFRDNHEHQLQHSDVLSADGTRTVVEFDEHLNQVRTELWAKDHKVPGTVITELYPDTLHTHFVSRSDGQFDTTEYFRENGTLERRAKISASSTRVTIFDSTGHKPLFEQSWAQVMSSDDAGVMVSRWFLSDLTEFDAQGNRVRTLSYSTDGVLLCQFRFDVTLSGVKYARAADFYGGTGLLESSKYYLRGAEDLSWLMYKPDHEDDFTAADNVRVVLPSPVESKPLDIDPHLPVPPAQWHEH
ncbi:MAG: hypothetical protein P4L53_06505 [Candidatus Obscuribacterales bacterium]|nr:hypothetical protein [Candidatus Obscuribacterales bacterium]